MPKAKGKGGKGGTHELSGTGGGEDNESYPQDGAPANGGVGYICPLEVEKEPDEEDSAEEELADYYVSLSEDESESGMDTNEADEGEPPPPVLVPTSKKAPRPPTQAEASPKESPKEKQAPRPQQSDLKNTLAPKALYVPPFKREREQEGTGFQ